MGLFTLAVTGTPQNASYQSQFANALNGTTAAQVAPYNTGAAGATPLTITGLTNGAAGSPTVSCGVTADTGPGRLLLSTIGTTGGTLGAYSSTGTLQATLWADSGGVLHADQGITTASDLSVSGAVTAASATATNSPTVGGALTVSGTVQGYANGAASGANLYPGNTANGWFSYTDDGSYAWFGANASGTGTRNIQIKGVNAVGSVIPSLAFLANGRALLVGNGLSLSNGGTITRVSTVGAQVPFISCSPSCYGKATISHGLGVTPTAAFTVCGDGGSGSTNQFIQGFDSLGSSSVNYWASETSANFMRGVFVAS